MKTRLILFIALVFLAGNIKAQESKASVQLAAAVYEEEVTGNLDKAVELYVDILKQYPNDRPVAAKTLYHLGLVNEKMGKQKATEYFTRLVKAYPDQTEIVALAKAKLAALTSSGESNRPEVVLRRIIKTDNGYNPIAGVSQDGKNVILNKNGDLWLHNLQSGEEKQITKAASRADWTFAYGTGSAYISRDSKLISYCWENKNFAELRLSAIDGSSMKVLHDGKDGRMIITGWMPDNQQILAVSEMEGGTYQLCLIDVNNGTIRNIGQSFLQRTSGWASARPSPDGRYIAFTKENDIYFFDTVTEQESVVVENPAIDLLTGWLPDGSGIVFGSNRAGTNDLYLQELENSKPVGDVKLLRRDFGANYGFCLTNDGKLFRIEQIGLGNSFTVQINKQTMKPSGKVLPVDTNNPGAELPLWSTDGKFLYYEIYKDNENTQLLFVCSELTGQTREVVLDPKLKFWYRPVLSPDGKQFIITGTSHDEKLGFGIFTVNFENGKVNQLVKITNSPSGNLVDPRPNWSPDGSSVFYKVRSPEKSNEFIILRKNLITGEEKEVYRGFPTRSTTISPDGTKFLYTRSDATDKSHVIGILDIKTGNVQDIGRFAISDAPGGINSCSWTPDGEYILLGKNLNQGSELWRFSAAGGPGEKLQSYPEESYGFVLHPDGEKMAFTQYQLRFELWALENFLPVKGNKAQTYGMSVRKIWEKADVTGSVSADGRILSFTDWESGGNVAIRNLANGKVQLLTKNGDINGSGGFAEPSLSSPDGKNVAYAWYSDGKRSLHLVGLDGSAPRLVKAAGNDILNIRPVAWSPDSRQILAECIKNDETHDMMLLNVADGSAKLLKAAGKDVSPGGTFSPDGKYIAWSVKEGISLFEIKTGTESLIFPDKLKHNVLGWTPDGKHILFSSERSGSNDAWLIRVTGGKTQGEPVFVRKNWGSIPMGFTNTGAFYFGADNNIFNIRTAELDPDKGKAVSELQSAFRHGNMRAPGWSPDGKYLAGITGGLDRQGVVIRSLDNGEEREIRMDGWTIGTGGLRWTPDGKAVVVAASAAGKGNHLIRIDIQTGQVKPLMQLPALSGWPRFCLSGDGNTVYFIRPAPGGNEPQLVAHNLNSGEEKTIFKNTGLIAGAVSPDGQHLLIMLSLEKDVQELLIMPVAGGETRKLIRIGDENEVPFWGTPAWTPDNRYVVFFKGTRGKERQRQLWRIPVEGGEPQPLGLEVTDQLIGSLHIHPDGRRIAIDDVKVNLEVWVMENFLPK